MAKYNTKQRQLIWNYLIDQKDKHVTVDEISDYFKREGTPVGKSTVYRFLDMLEKQDKVRKYIGRDKDSACYQIIIGENEKQYHLICTECGDLIHLQCSALNMIKDHIKLEHHFIIDTTKTTFYGHCSKCEEDYCV